MPSYVRPSEIGHRRPHRVAGGHVAGRGTRRVAVAFDDATFVEIAAYAEANKLSFGEANRILVRAGLAHHAGTASATPDGGKTS